MERIEKTKEQHVDIGAFRFKRNSKDINCQQQGSLVLLEASWKFESLVNGKQ